MIYSRNMIVHNGKVFIKIFHGYKCKKNRVAKGQRLRLFGYKDENQ